jgi:peptidoglycan/xylan/chitin deacetylase (PgdA/CDA1 family)
MENKMSSKVAILSYHKIGPPQPNGWDTWYYIPKSKFIDDLLQLSIMGYEFIDLPKLYRALDGELELAGKSALITFDDGYRNNLTVAMPAMRRLNVPGVVFVPTHYVGGTNVWDSGGPEPDEEICSWDELRELEKNQVMIESHSLSHPSFSNLSPADQEKELTQSRNILESQLNRPVQCFAYPYGDSGTDHALSESLLKKAGYKAGCLYGGGAVQIPGANRYRLERLAMGPDSDLKQLLGE